MSEAFFLWRLQCHRYLDVANKYHLYPGCLILVAVSRKNTDRHGNGNQKIGRLLLLQILQSDGQSERADFSHTRGGIVITCCLYVSHRTWLGRAPWSRCKFVYHLASNKRLLRSFFFSILMTGSAINIDFCFFSLRATQLIVPRWLVIKFLLIYFSGQDGGNRHYISFFTLPSTIYQRKFITIHF